MATKYCVRNPGVCDGSCDICPASKSICEGSSYSEADLFGWTNPKTLGPSYLEKQTKSDGGSSNYYKIPKGATELNDLIEHKQMSFALGNIFKACYRLGDKEGTDLKYDLNKIIYFAQRLKDQA